MSKVKCYDMTFSFTSSAQTAATACFPGTFNGFLNSWALILPQFFNYRISGSIAMSSAGGIGFWNSASSGIKSNTTTYSGSYDVPIVGGETFTLALQSSGSEGAGTLTWQPSGYGTTAVSITTCAAQSVHLYCWVDMSSPS